MNRPLQGCYRIALLSLKGGVGKTTITATLGATFASIRGDRVVAVDANPDRGTLSQKVPLETPATVRHLLRDAEGIDRYSDVRSYTSQGPSRLEVLASESDPAVSEAFSADDYSRTLDVLERFYSLVLTDCGTGLMHSAMSAVLAKADVLIVISSGSVDGARSASATLDWLDAHGHEKMVQELDCGDQRGASAVRQGRYAEGRRPFLPPLPGGAAGAVRPAPRGGRGDQPGTPAARDARGVDRVGGGGGRRISPARNGPPTCSEGAGLLGARVVPVPESAQEVGVVVGADRAGLWTAGRGAGQPPADVDQSGQDENEEQISHAKPPCI